MCYTIFCIFICTRVVGAMAISYNGLQKLLIDKSITKTEIRKRVDIGTNVLAKMGKNKTVPMDTAAKIAITVQCGLNDVVEISTE